MLPPSGLQQQNNWLPTYFESSYLKQTACQQIIIQQKYEAYSFQNILYHRPTR